MSPVQFWFSLKGRVSHYDIWLSLIPSVVGVIIMLYLPPAFYKAIPTLKQAAAHPSTLIAPLCLQILYGIETILFITVGVKRCHDRNRSGWFMILFLVPVVVIWPFVELYFFRGTRGDNRFGPDPLAQRHAHGQI